MQDNTMCEYVARVYYRDTNDQQNYTVLAKDRIQAEWAANELFGDVPERVSPKRGAKVMFVMQAATVYRQV